MQKRINSIKKQTDNKFLNMYELDYTHRDGKTSTYFMASRIPDADRLKMKSEEKPADAVMMYAITDDGRIVLEKQYRPVLDDYIYELPAGLCEQGELIEEAAVREFFEETGMKLTLIGNHNSSRPYYTSAGLSDESISTVFGTASGIPTTENQEDTEDIQVILADREECRRILHEENVTIMCAFLLLSFIKSDDDPFDFLV
jgi:ADP-ribose pyrophosphatase